MVHFRPDPSQWNFPFFYPFVIIQNYSPPALSCFLFDQTPVLGLVLRTGSGLCSFLSQEEEPKDSKPERQLPKDNPPGNNVPPWRQYVLRHLPWRHSAPKTLFPKDYLPPPQRQLAPETICPGRQHAPKTIRPRDNMPQDNMPQRLHAPGDNVPRETTCPRRQCAPETMCPVRQCAPKTMCPGRQCAPDKICPRVSVPWNTMPLFVPIGPLLASFGLVWPGLASFGTI